MEPTPPDKAAPSSSLSIVVRFTTSIPDLALDLASPSTTTVVSLKHLIRINIAPPTSQHRLRLIYGGKILPDTALLPHVLKIPPPPPRARAASDLKGKGRAVDFELHSRVYINCSIGDVLSVEELAAEASAAAIITEDASTTAGGMADQGQGHSTTTTPAPRGFDRLLLTGFTPAEVGQLRLQFLSIQASMHTPDTMPSPTSLRRMEDAWIDDNGATNGGGERDSDMTGAALDDLLWGLTIGFLWPLGAMGWLIREEGVWSARRQTAIWSGFMICMTYGVMKFLS